jgi:hypothetical protein
MKSFTKLLATIILFAISINGILGLPVILSTLHSDIQYLVAISQITYIVSGIAVGVGIWRTFRGIKLLTLIWGLTILCTTLGPFTFAPFMMTFTRISLIITSTIIIATLSLLWFVINNNRN